jgi:MFS transporter, ACDE family, multidrug resistance protein
VFLTTSGYMNVDGNDGKKVSLNLKKSILWLLLLSSTLTVMAGSIIGPVVRDIRIGLGVNPSSAGLIITMHGIFVFLLSPLVGVLIDKIGSKVPYVFGLLVYGAAGGAGLFLDSFPLLLVSRAFLGVGVALIYTSVTVMILNFYKGREKNKVMGFRGSANSIGAVAWPLIGGALGTISWHMPFGVYLLAVPLGFLALALMPNIERVITKRERSVISIFRENIVLAAIYTFMLLVNLLLYVNIVYLPEILEPLGITSSFQVSLFFAAMGIAGGTTATQYDWVKERVSYQQIVPTIFLLWSVGFSVGTFGDSIWTYVLSVALFGIGQGLALPTVMLWVGDLISPTFHGTFSSYLSTFGYLGQFLSPIVFAPIVTWLGLEQVYLAALIVALGGFACSLFYLYTQEEKRE